MNTPHSDFRSGSNGGDGRFQSPAFGNEAGVQGGTPAGAGAQGDASVGTLLKELAHEVPALLRNEIALAKSEMRENMQQMQKAVGEVATGGAIALAGLVVLLMAAVYALSNVMAPWLAALLVGAGALLAGFMLVSAGKRKLKNESLRPDRTMDSLRKDTSAIRGGTQ